MNAIPASSCVSAGGGAVKQPFVDRPFSVHSRTTHPWLHPPRVSSGVICTYQLRLSIPKGPPPSVTSLFLSYSRSNAARILKRADALRQPCVPHIFTGVLFRVLQEKRDRWYFVLCAQRLDIRRENCVTGTTEIASRVSVLPKVLLRYTRAACHSFENSTRLGHWSGRSSSFFLLFSRVQRWASFDLANEAAFKLLEVVGRWL